MVVNMDRLSIKAKISALIIAFAFIIITFTTAAASEALPAGENPLTPATTAMLEWFEPRGLNIVDLIGEVPEADLAGMILSYTPGYGIVRYVAGQRIGDTIVVTTTVSPRFVVDGGWNGTLFGCLGQPAKIDQLGSVSPPSTIRLLNGTKDVTREATLYYYVPTGLNKPIRNPVQSEAQNLYRYAESAMLTSSFTPTGELIMPGNMGCEIMISYRDYRELTAVFTLQAPPMVKVSLLGRQDLTFHSYLGVGYFGHLQSLVDQLRAAGYADRHEKFVLDIPEGADYFIANFPPMPADAYTAFLGNPRGNLDRITGGTYRIALAPGLSVDHVNSMGLPLYGHWQDSSQAGGEFLNFARTPLLLAMPEYALPPGVPYQVCMTDGGCSADLLKRVYTTQSSMRVLYLRVERISPLLTRYATQMVGPTWSPSLARTQLNNTLPHNEITYDYFVYLPNVSRQLPPDDGTDCSPLGGCGWFTTDGRMVDYVPLP